jgi:hypothetical protein
VRVAPHHTTSGAHATSCCLPPPPPSGSLAAASTLAPTDQAAAAVGAPAAGAPAVINTGPQARAAPTPAYMPAIARMGLEKHDAERLVLHRQRRRCAGAPPPPTRWRPGAGSCARPAPGARCRGRPLQSRAPRTAAPAPPPGTAAAPARCTGSRLSVVMSSLPGCFNCSMHGSRHHTPRHTLTQASSNTCTGLEGRTWRRTP